ncbi:hypothetical protein BUALT_Bualt19G0062500 [Buddleja alternifolia]|uniref:Uncharacterized protein n=1 Tax=Buddleja alternifolia TaxID=168488 RepID=A0AAV6WA02_9LAMI|nr:hypothetical protein BUALT_Bualt19G0062500 [Buddleja alternifolia]
MHGRGLPPLPAARLRPPRLEPINGEKTCPLLLRVFTKGGGHHTDDDFAVRGKEPKDERGGEHSTLTLTRGSPTAEASLSFQIGDYLERNLDSNTVPTVCKI